MGENVNVGHQKKSPLIYVHQARLDIIWFDSKTVLVLYQTAEIAPLFPQCFIKSLWSHHVSGKKKSLGIVKSLQKHLSGGKSCEIGFPFVAQFLSGDFFQRVLA